jgi:hypothetical protein
VLHERVGLIQVLGLIKRQIGSRTKNGWLFALVIDQPAFLRDVVGDLALARRAFGFIASGSCVRQVVAQAVQAESHNPLTLFGSRQIKGMILLGLC